MSRKYELWECEITGLNRICALRDIPRFDVKAGDIGGYIENERNLSQYEDCWIANNAQVCGNARVHGDALVHGNAQICGNAWIYENAQVYGKARVYGNALIHGKAQIYGDAQVYGNARVCRDARVENRCDFLCTTGLGSRYESTTFFRTPTGISVVCGGFDWSLENFRKRVKKKHGDTKFTREYELACQLAELHILEEEEQV